MKYKPKKNNKNAYIACAVYLALILAAFVFEGFQIGYTLMNQLMVLIFATAGVYALRYVIYDYVYSLDEKEGYLEVIRVGSKLPRTFASVKISSSDLVIKAQKDMGEYRHIKKERFNLTMFPGLSDLYWYIFTVNGERQALVLECEDSFAEILKTYIKNIDKNDSK